MKKTYNLNTLGYGLQNPILDQSANSDSTKFNFDNTVDNTVVHYSVTPNDAPTNDHNLPSASPVGIFKLNALGDRVLYVNDKICEITGVTAHELLGSKWLHIVHPQDKKSTITKWYYAIGHNIDFQHEFRILKPNKEIAWVFAQISPRKQQYTPEPGDAKTTNDANATSQQFIFGSITDITKIKTEELELKKLASSDPLTKLPNRYYFKELLQHSVEHAKCFNGKLAVIYLDLDNFKEINDTMGHDYGDRLLVLAAKRLKACVRGEDVVSRLGGDEFAIIINQIRDDNRTVDCETKLTYIAERIKQQFNRPFNINNDELISTVSIGIAIYPPHGSNATELVKHADVSLYNVKTNGKNDFSFFTSDINAKLHRQVLIGKKLKLAIQKHQEDFSINFQPHLQIKYDTIKNSGTVVGVEALLRWHDKELGTISPAEFIPIAESSLLINQLGNLAITKAIQNFSLLFNVAAGSEPQLQPHLKSQSQLKLHLNVSPNQILDPNFIEQITNTCQAAKVAPNLVVLEFTETAINKHPEKVNLITNKLAKLGFKIAIDNFGIGYSSLSRLTTMPVQIIKIDKSFVKKLPEGKHHVSVIKAIISLAHNLNITVIAEGVETKDEAEMLLDIGCNIHQGNYYTMPLELEKIKAYLRRG
jgi:diguanylate cyclase (GGDEF)-like protein/PAS domain S-box-containing protein